MAGMNIIVPLGGVGSRFQKEGYLKPKPFVRVLGKEMILWVIDSLQVSPGDTLVVVYNPRFLNMKHEMELVVDARPAVVLVELPRPTLGAAETVRFGLEGLSSTQRGRPCMLVDGDTFYACDIVGKYRAIAHRAGASFCFHDTQPKPIYSYVTMPRRDDGDCSIDRVVEKVKISDWANTGCYCFRDGDELLAYCAKIIERGETQLSQDQKGEFYTSGVIKAMLDDGLPFEGIVLDRGDMHVLGTPAQVVDFCHAWDKPPAYRVCFDIDNTLFSSPRVPGDYSTCVPVKRTIDMLKALHASGHYIILHTARRMRTHAANVGAVVADVAPVTFKSLEDAGIPYHEIHFGKPWAQFYVDDHAVNAYSDLEKELGFYLPVNMPALPSKYTTPAPSSSSSSSQSKNNAPPLPDVTPGGQPTTKKIWHLVNAS
ncbi:hypothetical protein CTAYLR_005275, partial [Chrysophaeum taylorii]